MRFLIPGITVVSLSISILLVIAGCTEKKIQQREVITQDEVVSEPIEMRSNSLTKIVCIVEGLSLKSLPSKNAKWLAGISFGEVIDFLGDSALDSTDRNRGYYHVRLSDGKEGWAAITGLALQCVPGVVVLETPLYKRPDVVTVTKNSFTFMTVVAVGMEKDGWIEVTGENRKLTGWAKKGAISTQPDDVGAAILAMQTFRENQQKPRTEVVRQVIENTPYPHSIIIRTLNQELAAVSATELNPPVEDVNPQPGTVPADLTPAQSLPQSPVEDVN